MVLSGVKEMVEWETEDFGWTRADNGQLKRSIIILGLLRVRAYVPFF